MYSMEYSLLTRLTSMEMSSHEGHDLGICSMRMPSLSLYSDTVHRQVTRRGGKKRSIGSIHGFSGTGSK